MPFVPVKCTSCGGDIQLDNQRQTGFCSYCGAQVIFEEAIKKMEIAGSVSVEGIATLEKKLEDAATYNKLGYTNHEYELLKKITEEYPGDYRGWWMLALHRFSYQPMINTDLGEFTFSCKKATINTFYYDNDYIKNALILAPPEKAQELKVRAKEWYEKELEYFERERNKLIEKRKYDEIARRIYHQGSKSYHNAKVQRGALAIGFVMAEVLFLIYQILHPTAWLLLLIPSQYLIIQYILIFVGGYRSRWGFDAWRSISWYYDKAWKESGINKDLYANFLNNDDISIDEMDAIIAEIRELIAQIQELAKVN